MFNSNHYLVILSGGWGTRLWPLSTKEKPKQFLHINSNKSLVEQTINTYNNLFLTKNIYLTTTKNYQKIACKHWKNLIVEPRKKNTALAIFLATQSIYKQNKNAIITIVPTDHIYKNPTQNITLIKKCQIHCQKNPNYIYILGQKPEKPDKSFTYLINQQKNIVKIVEKPSLLYSKKLLHKSIISADTFTFSAEFLTKIINNQNINTDYNTALPLSFEKFLKNNLDILSIYSDKFEFTDLGEWKNVFDILPKDKNKIVTNSKHFNNFESKNSLLLTGNKHKEYGIVGLNNIAIIDTPGELLICNLENDLSYNVKNLVKQINEKK
jgi:mannose-1-phosphate guanylyltransferase